jgi:hypothetical protein
VGPERAPPALTWSLLGEGIRSAFISSEVKSSHSKERAKWGACTLELLPIVCLSDYRIWSKVSYTVKYPISVRRP